MKKKTMNKFHDIYSIKGVLNNKFSIRSVKSLDLFFSLRKLRWLFEVETSYVITVVKDTISITDISILTCVAHTI